MDSRGFKYITLENWLQPDPTNAVFVGTPEDFLVAILAPQLTTDVPEAILRLFEVARGAMVYAQLFYPLYTAAWEQLFRVGEAAVSLKCKDLRAPQREETFSGKIDWLTAKGIFTDAEHTWWHWIRKGRNMVSHQEHQSIGLPGSAIAHLESVAAHINDLFAQSPTSAQGRQGRQYQVGDAVRVMPSHPRASRHGRIGRVAHSVGGSCLVHEYRPVWREPLQYWVDCGDLEQASEEEGAIQADLDT